LLVPPRMNTAGILICFMVWLLVLCCRLL